MMPDCTNHSNLMSLVGAHFYGTRRETQTSETGLFFGFLNNMKVQVKQSMSKQRGKKKSEIRDKNSDQESRTLTGKRAAKQPLFSCKVKKIIAEG